LTKTLQKLAKQKLATETNSIERKTKIAQKNGLSIVKEELCRG